MLDRIIIFCQFKAAAQLFGQIFPFHLPLLKSLLHRSDNGLVAESFGLSIYRLHRMHDTSVLLRGKHFRLLHGQPSVLFYHAPTKYQDLSHLQNVFQINHIVPGKLQNAGHVTHIRDDDPNVFKSAYRRHLHKLSGHSGCGFFLKIPNGNRFLISIISTRIVVEQFLHGFHPQLFKQARCFLPDSLQTCDRLLIHGPASSLLHRDQIIINRLSAFLKLDLHIRILLL